ncbi:MAG: DUF91 domain-containing protein, partial [Chloroflexi bacterium]|nr:DUF91 domain-containing protein [Chloroflexota bacterium]
MPQQIRIWEVGDDDLLKEVPASSLDREERLQNWLVRDISIVADDLLVIGREVPTAFGGRIDLLCLDSRGDLVVIELKRDKTPRDVTAQVLDYASWVKDLTVERINDLANDYLSDTATLAEVFRDRFGDDLPDTLNVDHRLLIVASAMHDSTERIVRYLSDAGIGINVVTFQHFSASDGKELMARVFLIEPTEAEAKAAATSKRAPRDTFERSRSLADEHGVGELYERLVKTLSEITEYQYPTKFGVSSMGDIGGTERVIMRVEPGRSNSSSGLRFDYYPQPFTEYTNSSPEDVSSWFP